VSNNCERWRRMRYGMSRKWMKTNVVSAASAGAALSRL
jgi:hypothetical protein